jgi:hypothetical protein
MENIHILPTDKPTRLFTSDSELTLAGYPKTTFKTGKNIYITSDEEIKEGNWVLNISNDKIFKQDNSKPDTYTLSFWRKIILTTDQDLIDDGVQAIDDEFLEWFVKNPSYESIEVVYEPKNFLDASQGWEYSIISKIPKEEAKYPNNLQGSVIDLSAENNTSYLPEQKRVMFKFDDDEPEYINSIVKGGKFIIELQEGIISFEKDGKKFQIYIETT